MTLQFVSCRFRPGDRQTYTYHWDGVDPLRPGDKADVDTDRGVLTVEVVEVLSAPPAFPTKPIIGRPQPDGQGALL